MNKLSEMIEELCPEGVEWRKLGEVCEISKGTQFNKTDMAKTGSYPVINGGITPSGYVEIYNQEANTITISQGGASAGYVNWMTSKFFAGAHCYIITPSEQVSNRYLYHFLKSSEFELQKRVFGAGIPALAKSSVESLLLPLPPLAVQQAIVGILDKFVQLEALLEAEKTAREKQYAYYRDKLLTFESGVEWRKLGEVCDYVRGLTYNKSQEAKKYEKNPIKIFRANNITIPNNTLNFNDVKLISPEVQVKKEKYLYKDDILICAGSGSKEHIGKVAYIFEDMDYSFGGFMAVIRCKDCCLNSRYLFHILTSDLFKHYLEVVLNTSTINNLSFEIMSNLLLPLPPLAEQERIVAILDAFDALTHDLTHGLPAEIETREKQYAYYRDKLLSFKQK